MGNQAKTNRARRQILTDRAVAADAAAIYGVGARRASSILSWIEANYQAPFAMSVRPSGSGYIVTEDDSFYTVAASPAEFADKRAFIDAVAEATMTMGILVLIDGESPEQIRDGRGLVRAWILADQGHPERLPVTPAVTAQLKADFEFLASFEHVEALPMTDLPAAA